jgi:hypothetical protein
MPEHSGPPVRRAPGWTPLTVSLSIVLLVATLGSFAVGFGVMTACTNDFSCTSTGCAPCAATGDWLSLGWIGQGVLVVAGLLLAVLTSRGIRLRAVRRLALVLGPASVALIVATTALAVGSY